MQQTFTEQAAKWRRGPSTPLYHRFANDKATLRMTQLNCPANRTVAISEPWPRKPKTKIITAFSASRSLPPPRTSARRFASLRASIILTSIPATRRRKRNSRPFRRPTTFSAIPRSGRFTTSLGSIPTISIRLRRMLTLVEVVSLGLAPATLGEASREVTVLAVRAMSISAALIFPTCLRAGAVAGGKLRPPGAAAFAIFSPVFLLAGGGGGVAAEGPEPGSDLEYQVNVPFWTAIRGGVMKLNITRRDVCGNCRGNGYIEAPGQCPQCHGKGTIEQTGGRMKFNVTCPRCHGTGKNISTCPVCHGEGSVERTDPLEIRIKAGTRDGQRIRIAGKGNAGVRGGGVGDLYVIIRIDGHPLFQREGDDIHIVVPVTAVEAALGSKIEVPTIDGRSMLKIPPGTQSGQKLRLREKGVPSATQDGVRGDEIVEVKITVPMPRDEKTKELLRELAKLNPEDPREELWSKV